MFFCTEIHSFRNISIVFTFLFWKMFYMVTHISNSNKKDWKRIQTWNNPKERTWLIKITSQLNPIQCNFCMYILHSVLNMFSAPLFYSWNLTVQFIGDNARGNWMLVNLGLKRKERNSGPMTECYCLSWVMYSRKYLAPCHDIQTSLLLVCASQPWSREFPVYSSSSSKPLTPGVTSFYFLPTISPPSHTLRSWE